jgi:hypothetical protein
MDVPRLQELLEEVDWEELLSQGEDIDEMYEAFLATLDNCVSQSTPEYVQDNTNRRKAPWKTRKQKCN